jgi:hypothetical protein
MIGTRRTSFPDGKEEVIPIDRNEGTANAIFYSVIKTPTTNIILPAIPGTLSAPHGIWKIDWQEQSDCKS